MVSKSARCELCFEMVGEGFYEIREDRSVYCHFDSSNLPGGSCWEKRVCEDVPEMEPWLWLLFECDGCEPDENGECQCTADGWNQKEM